MTVKVIVLVAAVSWLTHTMPQADYQRMRGTMRGSGSVEAKQPNPTTQTHQHKRAGDGLGPSVKAERLLAQPAPVRDYM